MQVATAGEHIYVSKIGGDEEGSVSQWKKLATITGGTVLTKF